MARVLQEFGLAAFAELPALPELDVSFRPAPKPVASIEPVRIAEVPPAAAAPTANAPPFKSSLRLLDLESTGSSLNPSMRLPNANRSIRALHEASTQPPVAMAAKALIDETIPADRADVHAGVVVSLSADKLTGGTHQASRLTSANAIPSVVSSARDA